MLLLEKNISIRKGLFYVAIHLWPYLEHIRVVVMAVLHHHRLVPRQSEGDAVLPAAVDSLQQQELGLTHSGTNYNYPDGSYVLLDSTVVTHFYFSILEMRMRPSMADCGLNVEFKLSSF